MQFYCMENQLVNVPFGFKMAHCFSGKGAIGALTKNLPNHWAIIAHILSVELCSIYNIKLNKIDVLCPVFKQSI